MSLTNFTLLDRENIQRALALPAAELEESSSLYSSLLRVEERDSRLGTNKVSLVRSLVGKILVADEAIDSLRSQTEYGAKRVKIDIQDEQLEEIEYDHGISLDAGQSKIKQKLQRELKRELGYVVNNSICLG